MKCTLLHMYCYNFSPSELCQGYVYDVDALCSQCHLILLTLLLFAFAVILGSWCLLHRLHLHLYNADIRLAVPARCCLRTPTHLCPGLCCKYSYIFLRLHSQMYVGLQNGVRSVGPGQLLGHLASLNHWKITWQVFLAGPTGTVSVTEAFFTPFFSLG